MYRFEKREWKKKPKEMKKGKHETNERGISHITGFISLESISHDVGFDHLARCHIRSPIQVNARINCTAGA